MTRGKRAGKSFVRNLLAVSACMCIFATAAHCAPLGPFSQIGGYWAKAYGHSLLSNDAYSVQQTSDRGYIVAGTGGPHGESTFALQVVKLNSGGNVEWQKTYETGEAGALIGKSVQQTRDGGYIVGCIMTSSESPHDAVILKLYPNGEVEWQKRYGTTIRDHLLYSVRQIDGGYIIPGWTSTYGAGKAKAWVMRLDESGSPVWSRSYSSGDWGYARSIEPTNDGGYIVAGISSSSSVWVFKIDGYGEVEWSKSYSNLASGSPLPGYGSSIRQLKDDSDDSYVVAAKVYRGDSFGGDLFVFKLNANGNIVWQKFIGGSESDDDVESIFPTCDGGCVLAGSTFPEGEGSRDCWALKLHNDGSIDWQRTYGGPRDDRARSIQQIHDGGYIMAGWTRSFASGQYDLWLLRLDRAGRIGRWCDAVSFSDFTVSDATVVEAVADYSTIVWQPPQFSAANVAAEESNLQVTDVCLFPPVLVYDFVPWVYDCRPMVVISAYPIAYSRPSPRDFIEGDWLNRMKYCLEWPVEVGEGLPRPCQPPEPICPHCAAAFSAYGQPKVVPEYLSDIYRGLIPLVGGGRHFKAPEDLAKMFEAMFIEIPSGPNYTDKLKARIKKALSNVRKSKEFSPEALGILVEAANAIELDLSVPEMSPAKLPAGTDSAVDFGGVAWTVFRGVEKTGEVSLNIMAGLPAWAQGHVPAWPVARYDFDFTGALAEDGRIDISFYVGGISFEGTYSDLHILQWDGKSYYDITTYRDPEKKTITGRANKLTTFVIMSSVAEQGRKLTEQKSKR